MKTPEAQRIAIAEACGWSRIDMGLNPGVSGKTLWLSGSSLQGTPPSDKDKPEDEQAYEKVPDYPSDLNAMHEAEKVLDAVDKAKFIDELHDILAKDQPGREVGWFEFVSATAAQRAEAFLRTLNLWTETP